MIYKNIVIWNIKFLSCGADKSNPKWTSLTFKIRKDTPPHFTFMSDTMQQELVALHARVYG